MPLLQIQKEIRKNANKEKAKILQGFFKTGKGQYGEGDIFLGLQVPISRKIAGQFPGLSMKEIEILLKSEVHEDRLISLLIVVDQYSDADPAKQEKIYKFYIKNAKRVNNWDLVDSSAENIVGPYLLNRDRAILYKLARSKNLWERRISVLSTFHFIKNGEVAETFKIAEILMDDSHDLIHKAVGWMLRECGKKVDEQKLKKFLDKNAAHMPRTMLRYSIEHFPPEVRRTFLKRGASAKTTRYL
jgi:3-methyladenine DNA glycosylase AlkD